MHACMHVKMSGTVGDGGAPLDARRSSRVTGVVAFVLVLGGVQHVSREIVWGAGAGVGLSAGARPGLRHKTVTQPPDIPLVNIALDRLPVRLRTTPSTTLSSTALSSGGVGDASMGGVIDGNLAPADRSKIASVKAIKSTKTPSSVTSDEGQPRWNADVDATSADGDAVVFLLRPSTAVSGAFRHKVSRTQCTKAYHLGI